ncbi:MAG: response regulator [Chlamydiota bacterium]|nr:response regulator [Chlamydiota bacterium]
MDWTKELQKQALYHDDVGDDNPIAEEDTSVEKPKLLLVDDNPDMLNFLTFQLQDDYIVYNAHNGEEGIQTAKAKRPDIIISDVMMPVKDGYQLCKELKAHKKTQHIPIILLTAKTDLSKKIEGLERGADEYLTKPFSSEEVRARVKTLLNARSMERDIQNRNDILSKTLKELKDAEGQLVHSAKMASIGQLAAGVAHEINNPLTSVMSSLNTLGRLQARAEAGEIDQTKYFKDMHTLYERIDTGMKRTKVIIDDLMNFARKDVEGLKAENLNQGVRSVLTLIEHRKTDDIQIHLDLNDIPEVECVLGQINQVLMNILLNAMDAIQATGDVWISTSKKDDQVELTIKDNGSGIPKDIQERIFEPFFTTKDVGKGTGLGLSISHKIIENHHGSIRCESNNGSGAAFIICLPVVQPRVQEMSLS